MRISRRVLLGGVAASAVGGMLSVGVAATRPTITVYKDPT
jgi:hypothetical protein